MAVLLLLLACNHDDGPSGAARRYFMGFSAIPPRMDTSLLIPTLTLASRHSDAGLIQLSVPWDVLLIDTAAEDPILVNLGRSITDTMIQRLYREYVSA